MTCRAYDNPYADQTDVPLCDGYSMNVHDGNWEYPATQRFALPVGGHCPARHEGLNPLSSPNGRTRRPWALLIAIAAAA